MAKGLRAMIGRASVALVAGCATYETTLTNSQGQTRASGKNGIVTGYYPPKRLRGLRGQGKSCGLFRRTAPKQSRYVMRAVIGVAPLLLTACVSSSEVVPIGNGEYMITGRASGGLNAGKETTEATKAANSYCEQQGKQMVLQHLDKTGNAAVFGENINLTFKCESK